VYFYTIALEYKPAAEVYFKRADLYFSLDNKDLAKSDYLEALKLDPGLSDRIVTRADDDKAENNNDDAAYFYSVALEYKPSADLYNKRAGVYFALDRKDKALSDYNEALRSDPGLVKDFTAAGDSFAKESMAANALFYYDLTINFAPSFEIFLKRADLYFSLNNKYSAKTDYLEALKLKPELLDGIIAKADENNSEDAIFFYTVALEYRPSGNLFKKRADIYFNAGQKDSAKPDYIEAAKLNEDFIDELKEKGHEYSSIKDTDNALYHYLIAAEFEPETDLLNTIGNMYINKNAFNNAIETFTKSLEIDAGNIYALKKRGDLFYEKHDYNAALIDYDRYISLLDDDIEVYQKRADIYVINNDYNSAIRDFTNILRYKPNDLAIRETRADFYAKTGEKEKAVGDYNILLISLPASERLLLKRADLHFDLKKYHLAMDDCKALLGINPNNEYYIQKRAYIYYLMNNTNISAIDLMTKKMIDEICNLYLAEKAKLENGFNKKTIKDTIKNLSTAVKNNPWDPYLNYLLGVANYTKGVNEFFKGELDESVKNLNNAVTLDPNIPEFYFWLAKIYSAKKNKDKTIENCQKAMALSPNESLKLQIDDLISKTL
jgi:tetratricopeptide (TPR) repeat protein